MSDFDDELEKFEQYESDPLDFFEEDEPRASADSAGHGVRILGADDSQDLDLDLEDSLDSFGQDEPTLAAPARYDEPVEPVEPVEVVEEVVEVFEEPVAEVEDVWPPPGGLSHRFPKAEEDEFWGETTRAGQPGWSEPEYAPGPAVAEEPQWTESGRHVAASDTAPEWTESGARLIEPDIEPDWANSPSSTTRFDALEFEGETPTGEASGPIPLPHWTEPPTGEVPRVVAGDDEPIEVDDDLESWASVSGQTPRFRVGESDWAESDFADPEALKDDTFDVGALSEAEVVVDDDAEFEEQVAARRRGFLGSRPRTKRPPAAPVDQSERVEERPRPRPRRPALERGDEMPPPEAGNSGGPGADLTTRVLTGVAIAVVALIMFKLGRGPAAFMVAIIVGLAAFELYEAFRRSGYHPATILGVIGAMAMVGIAYKSDNYGLQAFPLVTALIVVFTMLWYMAEVVKARPVVNIAITLFVFSYVGVLGAFGGLLLSAPNGTGLVLGVAICAVGYDVCGYFVGSQFGRSRMAPRLSPNKTWEGLFGGMLASLILGGILGKVLTPWDGSITDGLALGLVVAIVAPLGDLCESMIKRDLGVKDLGTILPGHGGILDRFDAILFCLPAVFYLAIQLGIG